LFIQVAMTNRVTNRTYLTQALLLPGLICWLVSSAASRLHAQGTVNYTIRFTGLIVAHVYGPEAPDPTVVKVGNTASETPSGTQTYTGALLMGSGWSAQLFAANGPGQLESSLSPVGTSVTSFRTGATLGGTIATSIQNIPSVPLGGTGTFQLRVWDNLGGTVTEWALAEPLWLNGNIAAGKSIVFDIESLGTPLTPPADMVNFRSFNTYWIPEPETWTLIFFGGSALLASRRGRRCLFKSP